MLFWFLIPWICQSVCLKSQGCLTVEAVKASINVLNVLCKSFIFLWYAKKKKYFDQFFPPGLLNWGTQIRWV